MRFSIIIFFSSYFLIFLVINQKEKMWEKFNDASNKQKKSHGMKRFLPSLEFP